MHIENQWHSNWVYMFRGSLADRLVSSQRGKVVLSLWLCLFPNWKTDHGRGAENRPTGGPVPRAEANPSFNSSLFAYLGN
jgi:hypothetical protein